MQSLLNFYPITDTVGTSGQPTREQLRRLADEGYTAVINLAMHDSDQAIPEEGNIVASLGMAYFHIPVPFDKPLPSHVKKFFGVMAALEGEKVLVHCALNMRVSAFIYKFLTLKKSTTAEEATTPILRQWLPDMDEAWQAVLDLSLDDIER